MASQTAGIMAGVSSCVSLAGHIMDLLMTAKGNKEEFRSLLVAVQSIYAFLKDLPEDGVTPQGTTVLRQLHAGLLPAQRLLSDVAQMGPLMSLIKANVVRDEFLRINRDITSTFSLLAAGEQLLDLVRSRSQQMKDAEQIRKQLQSCASEFFADEAAALGRLQDVAAAGKQGAWSEQKLQRRLLDQLQSVPEVSRLQPDELLAEYKALQMMVMYNGADSEPDAQQASKAKKGIDAETEEFFVQQVCAALAATVASSTSAPLQPEGAATAPADFLCPISQQLMVEPALLMETGHSFEAANIRRWLDINNTCPISRKQLHSKQLVPNLSLKRAIADWAACHGVIMPAAPTYASMHSSSLSAAEGSAADEAAAADQHDAQARASDAASAAASLGATGLTQPGQPGHGQSQGPFVVSLPGALSLKGAGRKGSGGGLRCTRTRWALGIAAALLVVAGIGAGVGVYLTVGRNKQAAPTASTPLAAPAVVTNVNGSDPISKGEAAGGPKQSRLFDGVSRSSQPYRVQVSPSAVWIYAESFNTQDEAAKFCKDAGGSLAVPSNAVEAAELNQLLERTLPYLAGWSYGSDADYLLWMGVKRGQDGSWGQNLQRLGNYTNWAAGQPSKEQDHGCSVLAWLWAKKEALWSGYVCGWSNMALDAVCKLRSVIGPDPLELPKGNFPEAPMPVVDDGLVVQPSPVFQTAAFNMTGLINVSNIMLNNMRTVTIFSEPLARKEAEQACRRLGGGSHMFIATSVDDIRTLSSAVAKLMRLAGNSELSDISLGAFKAANSTAWVWGSANSAVPSFFRETGMNLNALRNRTAPWTPGEPNGQFHEELCLEMKVRSNLKFSAWLNDEGCDRPRAFACSSPWL